MLLSAIAQICYPKTMIKTCMIIDKYNMEKGCKPNCKCGDLLHKKRTLEYIFKRNLYSLKICTK